MRRSLSHWLLALALLFGQHAAQLHAFSHVGEDFAGSGKGTAPTSHPAEHCLAFHALDGVVPVSLPDLPPVRLTAAPPAAVSLPIARLTRVEYRSGAPPPVA